MSKNSYVAVSDAVEVTKNFPVRKILGIKTPQFATKHLVEKHTEETHKAIELGDWRLAAQVTNIPNFYTTLQ